MKNISLILTLFITAKAFQVNELVTTTPKHDYTKCFELVAEIGIQVLKIIADATTSNIPGIIVAVIETIKDAYEAIECFIHNTDIHHIFSTLE